MRRSSASAVGANAARWERTSPSSSRRSATLYVYVICGTGAPLDEAPGCPREGRPVSRRGRSMKLEKWSEASTETKVVRIVIAAMAALILLNLPIIAIQLLSR